MKLFCKKVVVFLLVAMMLTTTCFSGVLAEEATVESVAVKIETLPDYKEFSDVTDKGFDDALTDAEKLIEELTSLTDDELEDLENASKVFDLYVALTLLKMSDGMPTLIPVTKEDVLAQMRWVHDSYAAEPELLSYLTEFTTLVKADPSDPFVQPLGDVLYLDYMDKLTKTFENIMEGMVALSEELQAEIAVESSSWVLEEYPDLFWYDNFWDYAAQFYYELYGTSHDDFTGYASIKMKSLNESFDVLLEVSSDDLIADLDTRIATQCDVEAAANASYLSLVMYHQISAQKLWDSAETLGFLCDKDPATLLSNYELLEEYYDIAVPILELLNYGDLDRNDEVDAKDALIVLKMAVQKMEMTIDDFWVGDVDGDESLDAKDALNILKYAVGKIDLFPIEEMDFDFE